MKTTHLMIVLGAVIATVMTSCHSTPQDTGPSDSAMGFIATAPGDSVDDFTVCCYLNDQPYLETEVNRQQGAWTYSPACNWPNDGNITIRAIARSAINGAIMIASSSFDKLPADHIIRLSFHQLQ